MRKNILILGVLLFNLSLNAQLEMPLDTICSQFERVKSICNEDNGELWGRSLYGPILVVDRTTKMIVANQPDLEGQLVQKEKVYVGKYPDNRIVTCTDTEFAGKSWAMVSYPFNRKDASDLYLTYIHESFHRIQKELGFNCEGYYNGHMDNMDARLYLNLEWLALLDAINESDNEGRNQSIQDALLFRQYRRQLFPGADTMESRFELHEGLAEYTAFKLYYNSQTEIRDKILERKSNYTDNEGSCIRSFGYYSGLLYAYLLDETDNSWQRKLKCGDDLGTLLQHLRGIDISVDTANWLTQTKLRYPFEKIYLRELKIKNKKEIIVSEYRIRFTKKPLLIIDLTGAHLGIYTNPIPIDTLGKVWPIIDISNDWGFLSVKDNGCLMTSGNAVISADNIDIGEQIISGDGWTLTLSNGWTIINENRNYIIKKKE